MTGMILSTIHESRRKPLARCVASIFALAAPTATLAATVTSCLDDGGAGTLRSVISAAAEGGTVDFTGLDCTVTSSKITLSGSAIYIARNSLTIDGTGATSALTIDASGLSHGGPVDSRVFWHGGTGTLAIKNLTLSGGFVQHYSYPPIGGCVLSPGNVTLDTVTVDHCATYSPTNNAYGGALYVVGNLSLTNSTVSYSNATGKGGSAKGGGCYVLGNLTVSNSSIEHNYATAVTGSEGGGARVKGNMAVDHGINIKYNTATAGTGDALGGGVFVRGDTTMDDTGTFNLFGHNYANSSSGAAKGGAAYAYGSFSGGAGSEIIDSSAISTSGAASGGGLYIHGGLTLTSSNVGHNNAKGGSTSYGGGANVHGISSISYSTVKYNRAYGSAVGGGLRLTGATSTITSSTISNNISDFNVGGVAVVGNGAGVTFELKNSTISSNSAVNLVGGVYADTASVKLFNSTIAFNTAGASAAGSFSPGVAFSTNSNPMGATLQSTLISNNTVGAVENDLSSHPTVTSVTFNGGALAIPANNLIRVTPVPVASLPTDTKLGVCPHLGPLRDNGGLTLTHALMSHSIAIDAGNDSSLLSPYDQRGSAVVNGTIDYTRYSGLSALADIGAYEVQQKDIVFNTDFEDCP